MEKEENINKNTDQNLDKESQDTKINEANDNHNEVGKDNDQDQNTPETLEEKIIKLEDKVARTFAEMENQRRRFEKEKEEAFEYGGFSFAREALNLIDNLERSKLTLESDETLKDSNALKKLLEHLNIINKDLISIFTKNNIKPIESLNKKLDPNFHQAMMEIEDDQNEPGTIIKEIQKGFTIKDRLLRPALVGVSKKKENKENESKKDEENNENQPQK